MPEFPRAQSYLGKLLETSLDETTDERLAELGRLWNALTAAEKASVRESLREARDVELRRLWGALTPAEKAIARESLPREPGAALSMLERYGSGDSKEQRDGKRGSSKLGLSVPLANFVSPRYRPRR